MRKKFFIIFAIALTLSLWFGNCPFALAEGGLLYLDPSVGTNPLGNNFSVIIKLDSGGQNINAAEGALNFNANLLQVSSMSKSGSIFSFWTTEPSFSNSKGTIVFGGGMPSPGYKGAGGKIITVNFQAKALGNAQLIFSSGAILANDGKGTNILTTMGSGNFTISPQIKAPDAGTAPASSTAPTAENVPPALPNEITISSPSHPDQNGWYREKNVKIDWVMPDNINSISYAFDNKPNTDPGDKGIEKITSKEYPDVSDGVWYFHIKGKTKEGWQETIHFRIQIDSTPPQPFAVSVDQPDPFDWPVLYFKTEDKQSGIMRYEAKIGSLDERGEVLDADNPSLKISKVEIGEHTAMIKAVDKAGNETYATLSFNVNPIETPVVKNYSAELKSNDQFFISGTALSNVDVVISVQDSDGKIQTKSVRSDQNGNWYFIGRLGLPDGRYVAWATAVNDQSLNSKPTPQISFMVTSPILIRFGDFVVNYFTVFVSLLFMILLIIFAAVYLAGIMRKRLKKETVEVEKVLHDNLNGLRSEIDKDLSQLAKYAGTEGFTKEKMRTKVALRDRISLTEKKIMKEIKDVEKILH